MIRVRSLFSVIDRKVGKNYKDIDDLTNIISQFNLIDIYGMF